MNNFKITVAITTYNRNDFLKEAIQSILQQTHQDFHILIGNDYTEYNMNFDNLGIKKDDRIMFFNHSKSLGEFSNMNFLLDKSKTKWFTWLADDDLMHKNFLSVMIKNIKKNPSIVASYSSYSQGVNYDCNKLVNLEKNIEKLNFKSFINKYSNNHISLIGCYGVIKTSVLKKIGGHPKLGNSFGPYSDSLLPILISSEGTILWQNIKLVFLRTHKDSISVKSTNLSAYNTAENEFLMKIQELINVNNFSNAFRNFIIYKLIIWFSHNSANVLKRNIKINFFQKLKIFFYKKFFIDIKHISIKFKLIYTIKILYLAYRIYK